MTVDELNALDQAAAKAEFTRCCGSSKWASALVRRRPYGNLEAVLNASDEEFAMIGPDDWREAFRHHPKIGDADALRKKFAETAAWASSEQVAVAQASENTLQALAEANAEYEARFGFIFIVCATGKSASEMLGILEDRLVNDPETELQNAAVEQMKITHLRLHKLLGEEA